MNLTDRQSYKDCDIIAARSFGCDLVQLKYDGWWDRIVIENGWVRHFSRTARMFKEHQLADTTVKCVLIGEHMQGTQWSQQPGRLGRTYLFDAWSWNDTDLTDMPYRDRYRIARLAPSFLPSTYEAIQCYKIDEAPVLWNQHVETNQFEGLVFRRSPDPVSASVYRHKKTFTEDLLCEGFIEGLGKFAGTLGAIRATTKDGTSVDVGGGLTDQDRREIWDNQDLYIGRWFEVEARAKFESGSLRHPNFIRWRTDK